MGVFFALLSAVGYTLQATFTRIGLLEKRCGTVSTLQFFIILSSQIIIVTFIGFAYLFNYNIIEEFYDLTFTAFALLALEGVLGPLSGLYLVTTAVSQIGAARASSLRSSNPLFTAILAVIIIGEKLTIINILSIIILIIGVVLVSYRSEIEASSLLPKTKIAGNLLALLSGLFFAMSQIARGLALDYGATPNTGVIIGGISALMILTIVCRLEVGSFKFAESINRSSIKYYFAAGLGTFIGRYALMAAFVTLPVWLAVAIRNSQPVIAILLSWALLRRTETINIRIIVGSLLIVSGVVFLVVY